MYNFILIMLSLQVQAHVTGQECSKRYNEELKCVAVQWTDFVTANYDEVIPGMYLGNAKAAQDLSILKDLGITHLLTIDIHRIPRHVISGGDIAYMYIHASDNLRQNLMPYFPLTNAFIEQGLKNGKVFVHCHCGVSRSATIVIAFLMEKYRWDYDTALAMLKSKRSCVHPNAGFETQLIEYYNSNYSVDSCNRINGYLHILALKHRYKIASAVILLAGLFIPLVVFI